jgi:hypothetical protein
LESLWDALHGTYNAASRQQVDLSTLNALDPLLERDWVGFSSCEMFDVLSVCLSCSTPGLDHVTWSHLKRILLDLVISGKILALADACLQVGYWPSDFKESVLVIILKLGKPSYSTTKLFQPIMLLNTLGKLIKKMISTRLQFDSIKFGVFHSNQLGGIQQWSTKDAGLFLIHLVKVGWVQGLKTSIVAFDIAQFFPSLNHEMLMAVLTWQGFPEHVQKFFASYLVGRGTRYLWNSFSSDRRSANVGVGQGLALSLVLSALYLALVMKLFKSQAAHLHCDVLSYIDDGTLIVQAKDWGSNLNCLREVYGIVFNLFKHFGLVLEHDKSELFHFMCKCGDTNPPLALSWGPFTKETLLKPKEHWRYLGFFFDHHLLFHEHVHFYATKAISMVHAMGMLGNLFCGLSPRQECIFYRSCVVPIATYGFKL